MNKNQSNKKNIPIPEDSDVTQSLETIDFKQSLVDTLQESNTARNEMKAVLHEILRQPDTQTELKEIINKIDRDEVKAFWKKFGFAIWSGVVFILGVIVTIIIESHLKKGN